MSKHVFDEKRIEVDEVGYNFVRVTPQEIANWGGYCVCNSCNGQFMHETQNLCFVLGDVYCDRCFEDLRKRWKKYDREDIEYDLKLQDEESLRWYKYHLDDDFRTEILKQNRERVSYIEIPTVNLADLISDEELKQFIENLGNDESLNQ